MRVPVFRDELRTCDVQPSPEVPIPNYPKMLGNELYQQTGTTDWVFRALLRYPSGLIQHGSMKLPPQSRDAAMTYLSSAAFWREWWETMIICMKGREGIT